MEKELMRRAVVLFPRTQYTDPATVRRVRRLWVRMVSKLRSAPGGSRWIFDQLVTQH